MADFPEPKPVEAASEAPGLVVDPNVETPVTTTEPEEPIKIEVVDDRPEDQRRPIPAKRAAPEDFIPPEDEIASYSQSVQKRIKRLTFENESERRRADQALREREEATRVAQMLFQQNQQLTQATQAGEEYLVKQLKEKTDRELELAQKAFKDAHALGDADAMVKAQTDLAKATTARAQLDTWRPRPAAPAEMPVQPVEARPPAPQLEPRTQQWLQDNKWFSLDGNSGDLEMTALAMATHRKLEQQGITPDSDQYWSTIDKRVREVFPDKFEAPARTAQPHTNGAPAPPVRRTTSPVTPVNRVPGQARTVTLTQSQVAVAKRLGITPEQYARQLILEETHVSTT